MQPNQNYIHHQPLCLIGIGSGACSIIERVAKLNPGLARYVGVNSEWNNLLKLDIDTKIFLGNESLGKFGCGGNLECGQVFAEEKFREIFSVIEGCSTVLIVACMGGGCASGGAHIVARIAQSLGASVISLVTSPFQFEGQKRSLNAQEGIAELRQFSDSLLIIPNDQLLHSEIATLPISLALNITDKRVEQFLITLHNLLNISSAIPIEQDTLNNVIKVGKGIWCENFMLPDIQGVKEQVHKILQMPVNSSVDILNAETCLAYFSVSQNTTLEDVHFCMEELHRAIPPNCGFQIALNTRDDQNPQVEISLLISGVGGTAIKPVEIESVQNRVGSNLIADPTEESIPYRDFVDIESAEIPAYIRKHVKIQ